MSNVIFDTANYISAINLPGNNPGNPYVLRDKQGRDFIDALSGEIASIKGITASTVVFCGSTTTELVDKAKPETIKIASATTIRGVDYAAGADYNPVLGDAFIYGNSEFIYDGTQFILLGDLSGLRALAYVKNVSADYTPSGDLTVTLDTTSATKTLTGNYTPSGNITVELTTTTGTVGSTAEYTPEGSVNLTLTKQNLTSTVDITANIVDLQTSSNTTSIKDISYTPVGTITLGNAVSNYNLTVNVPSANIILTQSSENRSTTATVPNLTSFNYKSSILTSNAYTPAGTVAITSNFEISTKNIMYLSTDENTNISSVVANVSANVSDEILTLDISRVATDTNQVVLSATSNPSASFTGTSGTISTSYNEISCVKSTTITDISYNVPTITAAKYNGASPVLTAHDRYLSGATFNGTSATLTSNVVLTDYVYGVSNRLNSINVPINGVVTGGTASFTGTGATINSTSTGNFVSAVSVKTQTFTGSQKQVSVSGSLLNAVSVSTTTFQGKASTIVSLPYQKD